jgi:hypothetical protein
VGAGTAAADDGPESIATLPTVVAGVGAGDLAGGAGDTVTANPLGVVHRQGTAVYLIISWRQKSSEMATGFFTMWSRSCSSILHHRTQTRPHLVEIEWSFRPHKCCSFETERVAKD